VLLVLVAVFSVLVMLGVPVAFSMGVAAVAGMAVDGSLPWNMLAHTTIYGTDSFVYLSIPLFILAGALMDRGGIAARLVRLAKVLTGRFRGGLAYSVVLFEMFFSGLSGSTVADVSAMTSMVVNSMKQVGYRKVSRILLTWLTYIGAAVALKRKGHIAVDRFLGLFPDAIRHYVDIATWILIVAFAAFLCVQGVTFALLSEHTTFAALQVPVSWQYLGLPVGCLLMVIYGSLHLVAAWRDRGGGRAHRVGG